MKKLSRILLFFLGLAFVVHAAGALMVVETAAMAAESKCAPQNEAVCDQTKELKPVMRKFKKMIDENPITRMLFTQMIDQVPLYYGENPEKYPPPYRYLKSVDQMVCLINEAIGKAPEYNNTELVGFPINGILNWTMGVPAGFAAYRVESVNAMFREILDVYGVFLDSEQSLTVLKKGSGSWRSEEAERALKMEQYDYDPEGEYWGFSSWNDFFTRKFEDIDKSRPVAEPDNHKVIVSAADSEVFNIASNVKRSDWFWVKSQPYSLVDMLDSDKYVDRFVGGDVYQAFLSATKYHRWHSPVSGRIVKAYIKQGTYYSATESEGEDPGSPNLSQGYIAHVATRAIIYIEADDPGIGLICIMPVGMAEVSSCKLSVKVGDPVQKGDELGYFQYGGSTHCLVFQPGVIKRFENGEGEAIEKGDAVVVRQKIAIAN